MKNMQNTQKTELKPKPMPVGP